MRSRRGAKGVRLRTIVIAALWIVAIGVAVVLLVASPFEDGRGRAQDRPEHPDVGALSERQEAREAPIVINVFEYGFNPSNTLIKTGQAVAFKGIGKEPHDIIAANDAGEPYFDRAEELGSTRPVFTEPGIYPIVCAIHPQMRGKITVVDRL